MSFHVSLSQEAQSDFEHCYGYIAQRSAQGSQAWVDEFYRVLKSLEENASSFGIAPESGRYQEDVRQLVFKTRKGNPYRALFVVRGEEVQVLHIRGKGQDFINDDEVR